MGFTAFDATFKLPGQAVSSAKGDAPDRSTMQYTSHQGSYFAHRITREGLGEDALAPSLLTARVDLNPHQVDVALFALSSRLSKGALLADEVGLGKTIEAGLAIAQCWTEPYPADVPAALRKCPPRMARNAINDAPANSGILGRLRVGNSFVNQGTIGAVVGVRPLQRNSCRGVGRRESFVQGSSGRPWREPDRPQRRLSA
jgi:hypothetical protein